MPLCACNETSNEGFDNKVFDISKNNDNSLLAKIKYVNNSTEGKYYTLSISGNGESKDYQNNAPWKSISKRIKNVDIAEGITKFGANVFSSLTLSSYILPSTTTYISSTSFNDDAILYIKNNTCEVPTDRKNVYFYSESAPTDKSKGYWHYVNDNPVVWSKIKALFIGNSFTYYNNIPKLTEEIIRSLGYDFTSEAVTCGAWTLTKFADKTDEYGKQVYEKLITNKDYDFVILQDQSTRSYTNYSAFYKAVESLNSLVKQTQSKAEVRLYSTWGYPDSSSTLKVTEMEEKVREKYIECGTSLNLKVHHVGKAFSKVYEENRDKVNIYFSDNKHPSHWGSFLAAHVHAMNILGIDTRSSTFSSYHSNEENNDWTINEEDSKILKDTAYTASF